MEYTLTQEMVKEYERHLWLAERSSGTIQKYLHNIEQFHRYLPRGKDGYERDGYRIQKEHCGEICHKYSKCSTGGAEGYFRF